MRVEDAYIQLLIFKMNPFNEDFVLFDYFGKIRPTLLGHYNYDWAFNKMKFGESNNEKASWK